MTGLQCCPVFADTSCLDCYMRKWLCIAAHSQDTAEDMESSDVAKRLAAMASALRAHMLVLMATERATVNLPPIHSHWPHWQGSPVLKLLG